MFRRTHIIYIYIHAVYNSVIGWSRLRFQDMEGGEDREDNESEVSAPKGHGHDSRQQ